MEIAISGYPWVYTSQSLLGRGERIRGRDRKYSVHEETGERWNEAVERVRGETNKRRKREGERERGIVAVGRGVARTFYASCCVGKGKKRREKERKEMKKRASSRAWSDVHS